MTDLLTPYALRDVTFRNRAWVPPMCMYSCFGRDGVVGDFHLAHYGARVAGGYGLVIAEATAVEPGGRISPEDAGLWNDDQERAWSRVVDLAHAHGGHLGIQLAHAGRKASVHGSRPGAESGSVAIEDGGWPTVGPSALAFPGLAEPRALSRPEIADLVDAFAAAAVRADRAGFDVVEVHGAHGYLLHQFLSPLSNHRDDDYGGSFDNRVRLLLEVVRAVRAVWPASKPLFVRISATDMAPDGWDVDQSVALARLLLNEGVDLMDVSSGGNVPASFAGIGPGYQVPFARAVRETGMPTAAVGLITTAEQADRILADGDADAVLFGREALRDPVLPLRVAREAGRDVQDAPSAYYRAYLPRPA